MGWSIVVYFFAVVCFYFSAIMPFKRQLVFSEQKTSILEQTVKQLKSEYAKKWEEQKGEVLEIIESFQQKEDEKDAVLTEFFRISRDFDVNIEQTEPLDEEFLADTVLKYSWKISCYADYPTLGAFFNELEKNPMFLCIETPTIQSEADRQTKKHKAEFLLSTYRLKGKK